ncbi:MAG: carotenoid biosynthesis protein [Anaerolineae bacterium]|nr:carotenoid biosynthesis protein [Anaerolineae bacterium]MDW8170945.1 carotenoid biosynthesis protein [Anaerolineae bacterium]
MTTLQHFVRSFPLHLDTHQRWSYGLIVVWLLAMIAFPIAYWIEGPTIIPSAITLAAVLQALAAFTALVFNWRIRQALRAFTIVALVTWFAEFVGSKTGLPFGDYTYTDVLQPQLFGVPLLIPVAWFMMLPSAWAMAHLILGQSPRPQRRLRFALLSSLVFTAWDLFLDPQMVAWHFWQWAYPVGYFGIPWINYLGWLLVSFVVTWLVNPHAMPNLGPLVVIYASVWFLQSVGLAWFWGQPGPALFGSLAMGLVMFLAYKRSTARSCAGEV